jgi:hypothetical protein
VFGPAQARLDPGKARFGPGFGPARTGDVPGPLSVGYETCRMMQPAGPGPGPVPGPCFSGAPPTG